uniref:Small ribosomal subunit protein uS3m n=1 Tax=Nitella hyalina TaxID=181804 RepID=H9LTB9_NITHY|nr:ribosomal protein S3 [Nitella hyalina]AEH42828.1 ribosomal protein S3 [Nitella hyalina]
MAQKVNPISVRLNVNRSPDSCWFSDYYYGELLYQDLNIREYFGSIRPPMGAQVFGFRPGRCVIHHFPKRTLIHLFFLSRTLQKSKTNPKNRSFDQSSKLIKHAIDYFVMQYFFYAKNRFKFDPASALIGFVCQKESYVRFAPGRYFYFAFLQSLLSSRAKTHTVIRPLKVASLYQSASLIAQEICNKLEQKTSFRQICRSIFQQIEKCNYVKGIRISCSGRNNGAEIAKTECRKYGQTSLHVFSDQIDYAQAQASTPYGILGVKVWVSYS